MDCGSTAVAANAAGQHGAVEQPSTEASGNMSSRAVEQGAREAPRRQAGREGGRRHRRAEPSREAGPPEGGGPEGQGGLVASSLAPRHGRPEADADGRQAAAGAGKALRRPSRA
jgi:hypothetical protein